MSSLPRFFHGNFSIHERHCCGNPHGSHCCREFFVFLVLFVNVVKFGVTEGSKKYILQFKNFLFTLFPLQPVDASLYRRNHSLLIFSCTRLTKWSAKYNLVIFFLRSTHLRRVRDFQEVLCFTWTLYTANLGV